MKKLLQLFPFFLLMLVVQAWPASGQVLAKQHQKRTGTAFFQKTPTLLHQSLKDALVHLKNTYQIDLLFEDKTIAGYQAPTIDFNRPVEVELKYLLQPLGLRFKKVKKNTYLIQNAKAGKNKERQASASLASDEQEALSSAVESVSWPNEQALMGAKEIAADQLITGTVRDPKGEALPGVNVVLKGASRGTTTDSKGEFRITVPDNAAILVFSFVGYQSQEVPVSSQSTLRIQLTPDEKSLSEVVVVGYGTVKRSDLTGSVVSVGEQSIKATPVVALDRALQGRAAGVQVTTNSAQPGGTTTIRIRGTGSVNATNEPLYVIDGYPTGDLNSINPNDIESVEILKDASATAIYGSRGSNGVVIVSTKRGKAGQSTINFETYYGVQSLRRKIPLLNAREYAEFVNEARINGGGKAYFDGSVADRPLPATLGEGTDWQNAVFRQAPIQSYQLSLSGGDSKTRYAISGNVFNQQGIILNSDFKRYTLRANLDRDISSRIKLGL